MIVDGGRLLDVFCGRKWGSGRVAGAAVHRTVVWGTGLLTGADASTSSSSRNAGTEVALTSHATRVSLSEQERRFRFEEIIRSDGDLMDLLTRLRGLRLPQWRLVAGCLYQTVWNVLTGRRHGTGIQDYDLIYFDDDDLSWDAEDAVIRRVADATSGCIGPVQVRNQARVHLWFESRFGAAYSPLRCADNALERYASVVHAVGVRLEADDRFDIVAPFGLDDLFAMVIRPNRVLDNAASHNRKALRAQAIWPEVTVVPWNADDAHA
jgi:uncharacterized protein